MKKFTLIFQKKSFAIGLKKQILTMLPVIMFLFFSVNLMAQNATELVSSLNNMKSVSAQNAVKSLVYDVHPTIYIENGVIKPFTGGQATRTDVDPKSFHKLYETNPLFSQVELITVRINSNEIKAPLNLGNLKSFTNLKYILFLCSSDCDPAAINNMFQPQIHPGISVFYQISIPN